jgi:murein DD-endopeptidase MepM/ murein hydrolase activator NlpD
MKMRKHKTSLCIGIPTALLLALCWHITTFAQNTNTVNVENQNTNSTPVNSSDPNQPAAQAPSVDISDLELKIREQKEHIDELEQQRTLYEQTVAKKRQEALSLSNQLGILDDQIAQTNVTIEKTTVEISLLQSEIERLQESIEKQTAHVHSQKGRLQELLRLLHRYHNKTTLEITLLNTTFAEFFNQLKYLQDVESEAKNRLDDLEAVKKDLEIEKNEQVEKRGESEERNRQLEIEKVNLTSQQSYREDLLKDTKESESKFEALLEQAKQEQLNANADIQSLEAQIRQRLSGSNQLPEGPTAFIWPMTSKKITAYFHDTTYPFRKYFEHPAIDIATPQGTAIRAAATGFVARAKNAGMGYSYIMIVHGDGLSTVYGHMSSIAVVEEDFVVQGQVIGYSGGTPGTQGAGRLTTGPHLHFEVRLNGIPVDPLGYLP